MTLTGGVITFLKSGLIVMNKKYALAEVNLKKIKNRIEGADRILLFLDYDGTLAPFKADPLSASALPEIETNLRKLENTTKYILSLISGRKLAELKKMINLKWGHYAGSHGLEIDLNFLEGIIYPYQDKEIDVLSRNNFQKIKEKYRHLADVQLEDKGFGLALHFNSKKQQERAEKELKVIFENTFYQVLSGRKVIEIRPEGWDKGKAVDYISDQIREKLDIDSYLRIYIGDDSTDEDAFKVLTDGITIYVQNEDSLNTAAEYFLKNPEDTAELLAEIAGEI